MNIRNQGTRMTRQVKPQAGIPVSTYYQEAFVSPFVPKSDSGARKARDRQSNRQTWRLDVYTREGIILKIFLSMFLFCIVTIRAQFPLGCKQLVKGHDLTQTSTIRWSINFANYSSLHILVNKFEKRNVLISTGKTPVEESRSVNFVRHNKVCKVSGEECKKITENKGKLRENIETYQGTFW